MGAQPPTDAEIKFARDSLVLQLPGSNETSGEVAGSYADILTYGLKDSTGTTTSDEVNAITPHEARDPPRRSSSTPKRSPGWSSATCRRSKPPVRKLNLGEVKVLDADGKVVR